MEKNFFVDSQRMDLYAFLCIEEMKKAISSDMKEMAISKKAFWSSIAMDMQRQIITQKPSVDSIPSKSIKKKDEEEMKASKSTDIAIEHYINQEIPSMLQGSYKICNIKTKKLIPSQGKSS